MKSLRLLITMALFLSWGSTLLAQNAYWVFLSDKQGSTFDPYTYFDAKAIERYRLNNADLYDLSNFPLSDSYVRQVNAIASEEVGQSRWFNAMGVMATPDQIERISQLPFVRQVLLIGGDMQLAGLSDTTIESLYDTTIHPTEQILRLQGEMFRNNGFDGKGIRIAVLDAGFPHVNTHRAFQHLRDSNRIIDTWNFVKRKKNVYTGNGHGTMVLSCITGILDSALLGLATGSEILLAVTETASEIFKEEVWWTMAMEWADKNGADIINSSLGYTDSRYNPTQMDGTSFVAQSVNLAARKGMLVCVAAGNERNNKDWVTISTPADADSALTVGAISEYSFFDWDPSNYSSLGPTSDGRLKPNVIAFGDVIAAHPECNTIFSTASGTSFATPLVAGFCACAWQTNRNLTAMELKSLIEQSADLYPYYDYSLGYGVPQASFFVAPTDKQPTFHFIQTDSTIQVKPILPFAKENNPIVHYKLQLSNGQIVEYAKRNINTEKEYNDTNWYLSIGKEAVWGASFYVNLNGYTDSIFVPAPDSLHISYIPLRPRFLKSEGLIESTEPFELLLVGGGYTGYNYHVDSNTLALTKPTRFRDGLYFSFGTMIHSGDELVTNLYSPSLRYGNTYSWNLNRHYSLGASYNVGMVNYRFNPTERNFIDNQIFSSENPSDVDYATLRRLRYWQVGLELFQRVTINKYKLISWDLGAYVETGGYRYRVKYMDNPATIDYDGAIHSFINPTFLDNERLNWGIVTRLSRNPFGIYARYRMSRLSESQPLPRLEVGINLTGFNL